MSITRLHLIDAASDQASATTLSLMACLLGRDAESSNDRVMLLGGATMQRDAQAAGLAGRADVQRFSVPFGQAWLGWPAVRNRLVNQAIQPEEVYAWSLGALALALLCLNRTPATLVATQVPTDKQIRWLLVLIRQAAWPVTIVATNSAIQHRLAERGIDPAIIRAIRPGLDWSLLTDQASQRKTVRQRLGLEDPAYRLAAIVSDPPSAADAKFVGMILSLASEASDSPSQKLKLLIHRRQAGAWRMVRILRALDRQNRLVFLPDDLSAPWQHFPACDLAIAAGSSAGGLSLLWATACGLPLVGEATPAICDVVEDHQTALLAKPNDPKRLSMRLVSLLADSAQAWQLKETARQQAFALYSRSRFQQEVLSPKPKLSMSLPVLGQVGDGMPIG